MATNQYTGPHGHASRGKKSPTYFSWASMRRRCTLKSHRQYKDYGGRGITVCARWMVFANFLADMGERPIGKTIDRIDGDKGYEPSNCKWSTRLEQNQKRRGNVYVEYLGKTQTLKQWARELGINYKTLHKRAMRVGADAAVRAPVVVVTLNHWHS
jgi:hypothetical protein